MSTKFDSYTQIHWCEIYYLERRLVGGYQQALRSAHTHTTWDAMMQMVNDGVLLLIKDDPVAPLFDLTDLGWEIAGRFRRCMAEGIMQANFTFEQQVPESWHGAQELRE